MRLYLVFNIALFSLLTLLSCEVGSENTLYEVTKDDFSEFISATNYVTDAEKFGWTFRQITISHFEVVEGETWRNSSYKQSEVTQISWNDAVAYCQWKGVRLPKLEEYWKYSTSDNQKDVWDWTEEGILAGGSFLCSIETCAGFKEGNEKTDISPDTTNSHIGFCVIG